eukprot:8341471-Pyramimonas_sp.AAC.1
MGKHVAMGKEGKSFQIATWKQKYTLRSGVRASAKKKWMWENEFIEHKATTAEGNWPRKRAKDEWTRMINDPKIKKLNTGPDGQETIKIKLGDYESSFDEESEQDEIEVMVQSKKKADQQGVRDMLSRSKGTGGTHQCPFVLTNLIGWHRVDALGASTRRLQPRNIRALLGPSWSPLAAPREL